MALDKGKILIEVDDADLVEHVKHLQQAFDKVKDIVLASRQLDRAYRALNKTTRKSADTMARLRKTYVRTQNVLRRQASVLKQQSTEIEKLRAKLKKLKKTLDDSNKAVDNATKKTRGLHSTYIQIATKIGITAYAIRKAFDIMREGAVAIDLRNTLSKQIDDFQQKLGEANSVMHGTVRELDLMRSMALMSSFGLDTKNFAKEMEMVAKMAKRTGQDVQYLMTSYATGVSRLSPRILDNLGIQINLSKAYADYAITLGKTADELTDVEKKQAVQNEVMRQAAELTEGINIGDSLTTTIDQVIAKYKNLVDNVAGTVAGFFDTVYPLIDGFLRLVSDDYAYQAQINDIYTERSSLANMIVEAQKAGNEETLRALEVAKKQYDIAVKMSSLAPELSKTFSNHLDKYIEEAKERARSQRINAQTGMMLSMHEIMAIEGVLTGDASLIEDEQYILLKRHFDQVVDLLTAYQEIEDTFSQYVSDVEDATAKEAIRNAFLKEANEYVRSFAKDIEGVFINQGHIIDGAAIMKSMLERTKKVTQERLALNKKLKKEKDGIVSATKEYVEQLDLARGFTSKTLLKEKELKELQLKIKDLKKHILDYSKEIKLTNEADIKTARVYIDTLKEKLQKYAEIEQTTKRLIEYNKSLLSRERLNFARYAVMSEEELKAERARLEAEMSEEKAKKQLLKLDTIILEYREKFGNLAGVATLEFGRGAVKNLLDAYSDLNKLLPKEKKIGRAVARRVKKEVEDTKLELNFDWRVPQAVKDFADFFAYHFKKAWHRAQTKWKILDQIDKDNRRLIQRYGEVFNEIPIGVDKDFQLQKLEDYEKIYQRIVDIAREAGLKMQDILPSFVNEHLAVKERIEELRQLNQTIQDLGNGLKFFGQQAQGIIGDDWIKFLVGGFGEFSKIMETMGEATATSHDKILAFTSFATHATTAFIKDQKDRAKVLSIMEAAAAFASAGAGNWASAAQHAVAATMYGLVAGGVLRLPSQGGNRKREQQARARSEQQAGRPLHVHIYGQPMYTQADLGVYIKQAVQEAEAQGR